MKKPGTPKVAISAALVELNSSRLLVALAERLPRHRRRDHLPEFLEPLDAGVPLVAGDDGGVDRPDRDAGDPFRLEAVVAQRLDRLPA